MWGFSIKLAIIDWVLRDELAVGQVPTKSNHIEMLIKEKIVSILGLCSEEEGKYPKDINKHFTCKRVVLPDHKYKRDPTIYEINSSINALSDLIVKGPVFVHCVASIERSPLICMAWLIKNHNLSINQALDYLMEIHPGTNPLPGQLKVLYSI